jgi:hypothetical protein
MMCWFIVAEPARIDEMIRIFVWSFGSILGSCDGCGQAVISGSNRLSVVRFNVPKPTARLPIRGGHET